MGWKDWDRTNKVVVAACGVVALAVIVTFAVLVLRPKEAKPTLPPTGPTPTRTSASVAPTPTFQCTTATGPDCTKDLADKEKARDAAYAQAEQNYLKVEKAIEGAYQDGGIANENELPPDLVALVDKEQRQDLYQELKDMNDVGWYMSGKTKVDFKRSKENPEWPTNSIILESCIDTSRVATIDRNTDEIVKNGTFESAKPEMRLIDGTWMLYDYGYVGEVKSC
ncbi:MAG: hypothetical protein L0G99_06525 [Propionibacteriales bacterium]|nr:hypothetical protein [Propionibacteriales bacterium]